MSKKDYRILDIAKKVREEFRRRKKKNVWSSDIMELAMDYGAKDIFEALTVVSVLSNDKSWLWHKRVLNLERRVRKLEETKK